MTQLTDTGTSTRTDLLTEVRRILESSEEPLTLPRIRSSLPAPFRAMSLEELGEALRRQAVANVLHQYPKYRSQQDRFWDRPMDVHVAMLLRTTLAESPLPWSELRRKLPSYTQTHAHEVLEREIAQGRLHRHPRIGRGGERFGIGPADPKDYLRLELVDLFRRLGELGFSQTQLRESALELLHDEEWSAAPEGSASTAERATNTASGNAEERRPAPQASEQPAPSPADSPQ